MIPNVTQHFSNESLLQGREKEGLKVRVRERKLLRVSENGKQRALARGLIQESRGANRPPKSEHRLG